MKLTQIKIILSMRTFLVPALAFLGGTVSMAQVLAPLDVTFSNLIGVTAPIYDVDGVTPLFGPTFRVELAYDATPLGGPQYAAVSPPAQFNIPPLHGFFSDGSRRIDGFHVGDTVTLWIRAWDSNMGTTTYDDATVRGTSKEVDLTVPAEPGPGAPLWPQSLTGLQSFYLEQVAVPEPGEVAAASGLLCLMFALSRKLVRARRAGARGG